MSEVYGIIVWKKMRCFLLANYVDPLVKSTVIKYFLGMTDSVENLL